MPYSESLARRVRSSLGTVRRMQEKKMFGGIAFMVNGKMCATVGPHRIMVRIDPDLHESALRRKSARAVTKGARKYIGYIHVDEEGLRSKSQMDFWLNLALDFNKRAKSARLKKKKQHPTPPVGSR